ncbi:MAG: hemagglutinin [Alphaproteobacteria bacterium]|nr:MAG: hemagglutinin [Alphaproteobacteria bacterium]
MSRIRSQLDSLLKEPQRVRQPDPEPRHGGDSAGSRAQPAQELERIRTIIDQLAGKIGAVAAERQAAAPRPAPAFATAAPQAASPDLGSMLSGEIRRQVNDQIDGLREQIGDLVAQVGQDRQDRGLHDEIHRLAEAMARLEEEVARAPGRLDAVATELNQLRTVIADYAGHQAPALDADALARTLEAGQERLAARLEQSVGALLGQVQRDDSQMHSQFGALSEHVGAIRDAIERLPFNFPVAAIERRLEELAAQIDGLAGSSDGSLAHDFRVVNDRLDEITRALVAMSVHPSDDALDRIEARLATLGKAVEAMAEEQRAAARPDAAGSFTDEIVAALAAIDHRLAELGREPPATADNLDAMTARLAFLSEKIDNLPGLAAAGAQLGDERQLVARLDEIVTRLDQVAGAAPGGDDDSITAALRELAERIDRLPGTAAGAPDTAQIAALERQLASIVAQIGSMSNARFDMAPLAQRLDSIEQQVVRSRDLAVEIASEAAERAAGLVRQQPGIDADLIERLRQEMRHLDTSARDIGVRNADALQSVHEALIAIAERLGEIEERIDVPRHRAEPAEETVPARHGSPRAEPAQAQAAPDRALAAAADETEDGALATVAEAPSLLGPAGDEAPPVDDVPLEPGSGAPDFIELVRQASAKRKSGDKASAAHGTSDLIAAARRAAQAAAEDAAATERQRPRDKPTADGKPSGGLKGLLARYRKLVLMASAAIVIAMAAVPLASRFMAGPAPVAQAPASQPAAVESAAAPNAARDRPAAVETDAPAPVQSAAPAIAGLEPASPAPVAPTPAEDEATAVTRSADPLLAPAPLGQTPQAPTPQAPTPGETITAVPMPPAEIGNVALRQAAAGGDGEALFEVARRYTEGDGVDRDLAKAAEWYEHSARSGLPLAQYRLANFFEKGHGVGVDLKKAVMWYQRAAEQGNALAMHNLAVLYTSGVVGEGPELKAAVHWFGKAAELGVKDSQVNLGILYARGMGVGEDLVEAYKWFAVAARAGDQDAAAKRDTLAGAMRPDQLTRARGLAELWQPTAIDPAANGAEIRPEWTKAASQSAEAAPPAVEAPAADHQLVRRAQQLLAERGFDPGPADGVMGRRTRDAIMDFQRNAGLPVDGEITADLIRALESGAA